VAGAFGGFPGLGSFPAFSALTLAHRARCAVAIRQRAAAQFGQSCMALIGVLNSLGELRRVQERIAGLREKVTAERKEKETGCDGPAVLMFPGTDASGPQPG
jgi:hypothetical protein